MIASGEAVWRQFGAAIDMLEGATRACPDDLWADPDQQPPPWRLVFHTLFWLDLYLTGRVEGFKPPEPFGLDELEWEGAPPRVYEKRELLDYLDYCRRKCRATIENLTEEEAREVCEFNWGRVEVGELLLYNLRHVQHGAAQLNLALRRAADTAGPWVGRTGQRLRT